MGKPATRVGGGRPLTQTFVRSILTCTCVASIGEATTTPRLQARPEPLASAPPAPPIHSLLCSCLACVPLRRPISWALRTSDDMPKHADRYRHGDNTCSVMHAGSQSRPRRASHDPAQIPLTWTSRQQRPVSSTAAKIVTCLQPVLRAPRSLVPLAICSDAEDLGPPLLVSARRANQASRCCSAASWPSFLNQRNHSLQRVLYPVGVGGL